MAVEVLRKHRRAVLLRIWFCSSKLTKTGESINVIRWCGRLTCARTSHLRDHSLSCIHLFARALTVLRFTVMWHMYNWKRRSRGRLLPIIPWLWTSWGIRLAIVGEGRGHWETEPNSVYMKGEEDTWEGHKQNKTKTLLVDSPSPIYRSQKKLSSTLKAVPCNAESLSPIYTDEKVPLAYMLESVAAQLQRHNKDKASPDLPISISDPYTLTKIHKGSTA